MITAAQIKQRTLEKVTQIAEEWITNCAEPAIAESSASGRFHATPSFEGVPSHEFSAPEAVRLLEERGFEAEHVYYDGPNGYDNYIIIKWGDA